MSDNKFKIESPFEPSGDQPEAIRDLCEGIERGEKNQVLLGVTGSGKTFTMAKVIEQCQRPSLIMAPNKILAAQLYSEMKEFFPNNHVEYFVSYYDYYQPEAYVPKTDTYIEKDSALNEQIDHSRTAPLANELEQILEHTGRGARSGHEFHHPQRLLRTVVTGRRLLEIGRAHV